MYVLIPTAISHETLAFGETAASRGRLRLLLSGRLADFLKW